MPNVTDGELLPFEQPPLKWWPLSSHPNFYIESKKPTGAKTFKRFGIHCLTADGHLAPAIRTEFQGAIIEAGTKYRAEARDAQGHIIYSPLYDSLQEAKDACDHHQTHGVFPQKSA